MNLVTIDFETYYSQDYSLSKMSTEDYVDDTRFEVILVSIKVNNKNTYWITGSHKDIKKHLLSLELNKCAVLAHHMMFDGLVLEAIFGIVPAMYLDTRLLAQALLKPFTRSVRLEACLEMLNVGVKKGNVVQKMKGRTRDSLTTAELEEYASYGMDDCEGCYRLFKCLADGFPRAELELIDMTLRMYLQPKFILDSNLMAEELGLVRAKKAQALAALPAGLTKANLMSNPKFAEALISYGVEPPKKVSPTTGQVTWAFAKTDPGWKDLEVEYMHDPVVSALIAARTSAKSTIEESRYERLLDISMRYDSFRIPIMYHAAHTGRDGGTEGINAQNFPRIDKSKMRFGIRAPKGYVVLAADLAQIEARITAWLAGQVNLLEAFAQGRDTYAEFISLATGKETIKKRSKEDDLRRFIGKTCVLGLGFGVGARKLQAALRAGTPSVLLDIMECEKLVMTYRQLYGKIPGLWRRLDSIIQVLAAGGQAKVGPCTFAKGSIVLPNEMTLTYANLHHVNNEDYQGWAYNFAGETRTLWGGKLTENIVQALARCLVMSMALEIKHTIGIIPALRQHDELDYIVPEKYAAKIKLALQKIMTKSPWWAPTLPVAVEIEYGPTLGDCK